MTDRARLARWLALAARLTFALLIVILPFRARADVLPHPASSVPAVLSDLVIYAVDVLGLATLALWLLARVLDRRPIDPGRASCDCPCWCSSAWRGSRSRSGSSPP